MSVVELTHDDWEARLRYFETEKDIGERHVSYAVGQIAVATEHLSGQLELEFPAG